MKIHSSPLFSIFTLGLLLTVAVFITYWPSLSVPFYFDDYSSIVSNDAIKDLSNTQAIWEFAHLRFVTYYSFALNYHWAELDLFHLHTTNILLHLVTCFSVWWLAAMLLPKQGIKAAWVPFIIALLFALHPLNTQPVVYLVQRGVILAALGFVVALCCYVKLRCAETIPTRGLWLGGVILASVFAIFSKQNAVVLPAILVLIEVTFFQKNWRPKGVVASLAFLAAIAAVLAMNLVLTGNPVEFLALDQLLRETDLLSRQEYFHAQVSAVWLYIKLFFVPEPLKLHYNYYFYLASSEHQFWLASMSHLLLIAFALVMNKRVAVISFAILFYYLTHLVESSALPIKDVIFEHRAYLPNMGLCFLVVTVVYWFLQKFEVLKKPASLLFGCALLLLTYMAFERNQLWQDPIAFSKQNVVAEPGSQTAWNMYAFYLLEQERYEEALKALENAFKTDKYGNGSNYFDSEMVSNLLLTYWRLGLYDKAEDLYQKTESHIVDKKLKTGFLVERANAYVKQGELQTAVDLYAQALELDEENEAAWVNLGTAHAMAGSYQSSAQIFEHVLSLNPANQEAISNLAKLKAMLSNK
ncbi:tetratricopeptide repeat protein [Motilimonas pumila]|uniref:Tetratricopeptide repeat protein n=1 Tax=Motilimonas pumila TaxID=2303987 RepID=A0A418YDW0_9GAMM|nr:tetratricopeptide repeat protein [Motilimonas pumila]RJG42719.1 tetratricopeptide repeat protein [Motilimonas pumila]